MSRQKILFVDGDQGILAGLRRILRPLRDEWDMRFFASPDQALDAAGSEKFDLVVSEMHLPGMDGVGFFDEVRRRHPDVVRVMLSSQQKQMGKMRSTGVANQYVSKPCDAATLERTVNRASALRRDLHDPALLSTIAKTKTLPPAPSLYYQLTQELRSEDPSLAKIGAIVSKDPAMTAKILQVVNSAYFGLRRRVGDIGQAVTLLGIDTIMALVLSVQIFRHAKLSAAQTALVEGLWVRSLGVAQVAKAIMKTDVATRGAADEAYLAGILSECGKLVFAANWGNEFSRIEHAVGGIAEERATFGADHAFVGAYLMALWGLPDDIVEAVAYHHEPSQCEAGGSPVLAAVHAAHVLTQRANPHEAPVFDDVFLLGAGLTEKVDDWIGAADDLQYAREYA